MLFCSHFNSFHSFSSSYYYNRDDDEDDDEEYEEKVNALVSRLDETRRRVKRHGRLEQELKAQRSLMNDLCTRTRELVTRKHFAHVQLLARVDELDTAWSRLERRSGERTLRLSRALAVAEFVSESRELVHWLAHKHAELMNAHAQLAATTTTTTTTAAAAVEVDDLTVLSQLKRLRALRVELDDVDVSIEASARTATTLSSSSVPPVVARVHRQLEEARGHVRSLVDAHERRLDVVQQALDVERQLEQCMAALLDEKLAASSTDFGADLEHAQSLLAKLDERHAELVGGNGNGDGDGEANGDQLRQRVEMLGERVERLVIAAATESGRESDETASATTVLLLLPVWLVERIEERADECASLWRDIDTLLKARRQTLEGAVELHAFDKRLDELAEWLSDKQQLLVTSNALNHNDDNDDDMSMSMMMDDAATLVTLDTQLAALEHEMIAGNEGSEGEGGGARLDELERLEAERERLALKYAEASDHVSARMSDARARFERLGHLVSRSRERVQRAQEQLAHASQFAELAEWMRALCSKMTAAAAHVFSSSSSSLVDQRAKELDMAMRRHGELRADIDAAQQRIGAFLAKTKQQMAESTSISSSSKKTLKELGEHHEAIAALNTSLLDTWHSRHAVYEEMLEHAKLAKEIRRLDEWLTSHGGALLSAPDNNNDNDNNKDDMNDEQLDALIKQHDELANMLAAMEERFAALKRDSSKLDARLAELREREAANQRRALQQHELERSREAERKRRVHARRMDERRRTQEIIMASSLPAVAPPAAVVSPAAVDDETTAINNNNNDSISDVSAFDHRRAAVESASFRIQQQQQQQHQLQQQRRRDRHRTRSIRDKYRVPLTLGAPSVSGTLMRKQEYQKGGQRAPIREYQPFFASIHGSLMCFFGDESDYRQLQAAAPPVNLSACVCRRLEDATLCRDVLHVETADHAEYLFDATTPEQLDMWMQKIQDASSSSSSSAPITLTSTALGMCLSTKYDAT